MAQNNFDLVNLALQCICPNNELIYDDKGKPSVMVKIPKMTYAQLGLGSSDKVHPAFTIDGVEKNAIWISKYQNIVHDGRAYSLPAQDPRALITFEQAIDACKAKGEGWHLMTRAEWALLALWCLKNNSMPRGNNSYGKDHEESVYSAIPLMARDGESRIQRVATGTGPLTWSHDGSPSGIWDLNGNVWEWVGGLRTVYSEIQILADNNAANHGNDQKENAATWMAINASTGALMKPTGSGTTAGAVHLNWSNNLWSYSANPGTDSTNTNHYCVFEKVTADETILEPAKLVLQALALLPAVSTSNAYHGDGFWADITKAERSFYCGGSWYDGAPAGVFALYGYGARSFSVAVIGFRAAFYE